ncbi:MAG TPA: type I-B CRISPR-associated protein Cas7/Cst2/DevR [Chloroflexaceae bacterium]|nr:type I-B CRISPR-associated protein Cas7/Cst2/DevR [Chloroflexaceae bacterium]
MAFISGTLLIDAPASALNNAGAVAGARTDNTIAVKSIRTRTGESYPYVSAQAFRYWLRTSLEELPDTGWRAAPIFRETKVAYTDANPIEFWDDDLFGYMRAPSTKKAAQEARAADATRAAETPLTEGVTLTRAAPFRVGTLVSIAPTNITEDFGTMARHDGDPVPHEHQFYRTTLKGLFSLDLYACGTFSYRKKTGFRHLDDVRIELARQRGLTHLEREQSYRLAAEERLRRVRALMEGMARIEGGAKQTIHYTAVAPAATILAVTRGGNHIFGYVVGEERGLPVFKPEALGEALEVFADEILSPVYIGWTRGFHDGQRAAVEQFTATNPRVRLMHPRHAFQQLSADLAANPGWLE